MSLSGMVPYRGLPAWMYHAQLPPPSRELDLKTFGITWVDLVFPFFLFAMGAAIVFALGRRIEKGESTASIVKGVLIRGLMLAAFAEVRPHFSAYAISSKPSLAVWLLALLGFVAMVLMFARWPSEWPRTRRWGLTTLGWAIFFATVPFITYNDGVKGFANYRVDVILMVLANVYVSGSLIYLATQNRLAARIVALLAVAAILLAADAGGIAHALYTWSPYDAVHFDAFRYARFVPKIYNPEFQKYLMLVIPGTIAGDLLLAERSVPSMRWPVALGGWALAAIACVGLLAREVPLTGFGLLVVWLVMWRTPGDGDRPVLNWAGAFLLLGILLEPLSGGIRKEGTTMSYYLVTAGLAFALLASLAYVRSKGWRPIELTGQNPILGYAAITNLIPALFGVLTIETTIGDGTGYQPWSVLAYGLLKTALVAAATAWATKRRFFLRA